LIFIVASGVDDDFLIVNQTFLQKTSGKHITSFQEKIISRFLRLRHIAISFNYGRLVHNDTIFSLMQLEQIESDCASLFTFEALKSVHS
jgi:hypothetical protein